MWVEVGTLKELRKSSQRMASGSAFRKPWNDWGSKVIIGVKIIDKYEIPWKYVEGSIVSRLLFNVVGQVIRSIAVCSGSYRVPIWFPLCPTLILIATLDKLLKLWAVFFLVLQIILLPKTKTNFPLFFNSFPYSHSFGSLYPRSW